MKPRIAIPVPTSGNPEYNAANWPAYADSVRASGGEPMRIELGLSDMELARVMAECGGFVLPGSPADVDATSYGQRRGEFTADPDLPRERVDRLLLETAWTAGKPLLGICFGMQMMNVWRGGALIQDLAPVPVNHSAGRSVVAAHSVLVDSRTDLGGLLSGVQSAAGIEYRRLMVNSSHHQAVSLLGSDLRVAARSVEDGVVEAIESTSRLGLFLGVQWHPERSFTHDDASRVLFENLVRAGGRLAERAVLGMGE